MGTRDVVRRRLFDCGDGGGGEDRNTMTMSAMLSSGAHMQIGDCNYLISSEMMIDMYSTRVR